MVKQEGAETRGGLPSGLSKPDGVSFGRKVGIRTRIFLYISGL
jgi:hypothetical protein